MNHYKLVLSSDKEINDHDFEEMMKSIFSTDRYHVSVTEQIICAKFDVKEAFNVTNFAEYKNENENKND